MYNNSRSGSNFGGSRGGSASSSSPRSGSSSSSHPHSSHSRPGQGSRSGSSGHSRFGGRPQQGRSRNRFAEKKIDVSRYVNKSVVKVEVAAYVPTHAFADFAIDERLKATIKTKGYVTPTPIQDQAIPHVLKGSDVVGIANTGTGKTAAFLIPLINKVLLNKDEQILIVVPTRELAFQIDEEFKAFARGLRMFSACLVGGAPIGRQLSQLRYHNSFVIGTPGRIKDVIDRKALNLKSFKTVVLDEADRMLDMGFIDDMKLLMSQMSPVRHTLFFSATLSPEIERLIGSFLNNPVRVSVKTGDTSKNIEQDVIKVLQNQNKIDLLHDLLKKEGFGKVLVFGRTKHGVQKLSDVLEKRGHKASAIHGNKNLKQRQRALEDFKSNKTNVLIATDVAARGLDIADVTHVINFDLPATHEDYVHRIGRTGRGDKKGKALTFVD